MLIETLISIRGHLLLWGLLATLVMTTALQASQGLGISRLSFSFLVGTLFTGRRTYANVVGFILYALGGWAFAVVYVAFFLSIGLGNWWVGALFGIAHGIVILVVMLPLVPYVHPRMASEYDGPSQLQRLEPPGFIGLNYGYRTPLSVLVSQAAYGAVLGLCFELSRPLAG